MEPINIRRRDLLETPHTQSEADGVFTTDMVAPLESLEVTLEPTQGGSGTPAPDNVRPIIGKTQVAVTQRGKNLFDKTSVTPSSMTCYTSSGDPVTRSGIEYHLPAGTYTLRCNSETVYTYVYTNVLDADGTFVSFASLSMGAAAGWRTVTVTLTEGQYLLIFKGATTTLDLSMDLQIELGTEATTYEPYAGRGYIVEFPALGKNLYDCAEFSSYKQADGTYRLTGADATGIKVYFPQELVGKELVLSVYLDLTKETGPTYIRLRAVINGENKNGATVNNNAAGYSTVTATPTSTSDYFYMTYGSNGNNYYTFSQFQVEIKTGSSRTSYEPYTNTVYKGTVDIASGTLTVNRKIKVINAIDTVLGSPKYIKSDAIDGYINVSEIYPSKGPTGYGAGELMADRLNFQNKGIWATVGFPNCWTVNGIQIHINVANDLLGVTDYTQETTATAKGKLNTWLASNPVTVTIPIQPKVYQLSPTQVMSLPKDNVFLSEDGDITYTTHWRHTISLPSAYQRIRYLESTGTQYINTGKIPTDNTRMQLKYYTTSTGSFYCAGARSGSSTVYFAQSGATSGAKVSCTVNGTSVTAEDSEGVDFKRVSSGQLFEIMIQTNTDSTYDYSIVDYTHNKYFRTTGVSYTPMGTVSDPICLFALNSSCVVSGTNRCYYFKLYRNGRIIVDGVPCYRKSDGVAGLYDLVTGTFFTNSGSGEFVKGPDI